MTISEKVAYIQGLYDGMGLDAAASNEARILSEMLDVLREMGLQMEDMDATLDEYGEAIDVISDDLEDVEKVVFDDEDEEEDELLDELDDFDEDDFFEVECPNCGEDLVIDDMVLEAGTVDCPACGQKFALSFEEDEKEND